MKTFTFFLLVACAVALAQGFYYQPAFLEDLRARPDGRIISGSPAVNGQFPHQAFILTTTSGGGRSACGGSLITTRWIMTAAHCVQGVSSQVHLGHVAHASSPVVVTSNNLIPHPNYSSFNLNNDIALIGLSSDVSLTGNIRTIPFARDPSVTFNGLEATVSGFGLTSNTGAVSPTLNFVGVRVITNAVCQQTYGASVIISSTICVVGRDTTTQGTCGGDSGGPLILPINGVSTQIGVVSFGSNAGCTSAHPNGFVRPSHFVSWINSWTGL